MRIALYAMLAFGAAQTLPAQSRDTVAGPVLSLDDAISLALRNNPTHLETVNARQRAGAVVRSAYGQLLPSVSTNFNSQYREGRQQFVNGVAFGATSDVVSSSANISVNANYSASSFLNTKAQKANLDAAESDVVGSQQNLRAQVAQQYLTVLQQAARAQLQDTLLVSAQMQLDLAKARSAVGAGTILDVRRAEVAVGQVRVALLNARNQIEIEKLRLFQLMGVAQPANVRLTTTLPVTEPTFTADQLLAMARDRNPALNALRSREKAADINARSAHTQYLPSLSLSTGIGGYTSQQTNSDVAVDQARAQALSSQASCFSTDSLRTRAGLPSIASRCAGIVFTDADAERIRSANSVFPFSFSRNPLTFFAQLSLPLFDGFTREQRIEEAAVARSDARYQVRAQELRLTGDVTAAYLTLQAAYKTVQLQDQNSATAREALMLAEERFKVGANTSVDVAQARSDFERAETDRINAVYDYHKAFAALESAVGRPLR